MKQIQSLQKEIDACRQVNAFLMIKWKELSTEMNLGECIGLGKDVGADVAICHIAKEFNDLKKENEALKDSEQMTLELWQDAEEENKTLKAQIRLHQNTEDRLRILHKTTGWREACCDFNCSFSASETLGFIQSETDDKALIKYVFDMTEDPFYYDIDKDEIFNREDYSSESE